MTDSSHERTAIDKTNARREKGSVRLAWASNNGGRAAVLAAILTQACGGGSPPARPHPGAGGGSPDAPDLGSIVNGTALLTGDMDIGGVTSDDVVAAVYATGGAVAMPVSGGPIQQFDPAAQVVRALGPVIFSFHNFDLVSGFGDLTIWTAANGAVPFVDGATFNGAVSDDGTRILTTGHTTSDATTTSLVLGGIDGAPPTVLFPLTTACPPRLFFAGGTFVVAACAASSTPAAAVWAIDPTTGQATTLLQGGTQIAAVPGTSGDLVLGESDGSARLVPVSGAPPETLGSAVDQIFVSPDGSAVLLRSQGKIVRVPLASGDPVTLAPTGVVHISGVSPDGQQVMFQTTEGLKVGFGDLQLTSAAQAGPIVGLSGDANTTIFHSAFTDDSSWALYFTGADLYGVGTFTVAPVAGGAPAVIGGGGWTVVGVGGARIVFTDGYTPIAKRPGRGVLRFADLASGEAPAIIATHAGADFYLTHARDQVLFSFNDGSPQSGIYAAPVP
jgi:hypothetical protein